MKNHPYLLSGCILLAGIMLNTVLPSSPVASFLMALGLLGLIYVWARRRHRQ